MNDLDPSGTKIIKDDMQNRVSMLENLGILESLSEEAVIALQSHHDVKVVPESKDGEHQQQQKQLLEPIQACTQDADVDQIMLDKGISHLLEMTNEVMHDEGNPPQPVHQQQQKQLLEPIQACTQDADVDQIMLDKRILYLLEMTNEVMHDAENPPQAAPSLISQMDPPRLRQGSELPARPNMQLRPGAYRQGGLLSSETRDGDNTRVSVSGETVPCSTRLDLNSDTNHDHHGLISAEPVTLPIHAAEPMDNNDHGPPKRDNSSHHLLFLLGTCLLLTGVVFLIIFLQDPYNDSDSSSLSVNDSASTSSPTPWSWDLPFSIPKLTVYTIEQDTNRFTPQARAYDWMKNDPHLATYSEDRLLQRFVMVVFYYATMGKEWTNQGGGSVIIDITLLQQRPGPPLRQRFLSSHSSARLLQQQHAANTTDASFVLQGSPAISGGRPPQDGSNSQGNHTNGPPAGGSSSGPIPLHPSGQVNLTSEPWLSYNYSECAWISFSQIWRNTTICNKSDELQYLSLVTNNLGGSLPLELGLLSGIETLEMAYNKIGGPVISELGTMSSLQKLQLFRNMLTGRLPSQLGQLKLLSLELLSNLLTGTVPLSIWKMSTLKEFKIGENAISGSLPNDIGMGLTEIEHFSIPRNHFTGSLPESLGLMAHLGVLILGGNKFSNSVPSELGNLSKLHSLVLEFNQLSGVLPSELGQLSNLMFLTLEGNANLGGTLPTELAALNGTLKVLRFKDTSITGTIPASLCGVHELSFDCSASLCGCNCTCDTT